MSPSKEHQKLNATNLLEFGIVVQGCKKNKKQSSFSKAAPFSLLIHSFPSQVNKNKYLLKYFYRILEREKCNC